ncbi:MAG: HEPN domain-containing protein [Ignisphaera sp.]|uniref:HEPN domain-containing protein n=1 Tax=Ignisphaera aggregans TaxID=334771 RepID=A0A7C4NQX0_9CREN
MRSEALKWLAQAESDCRKAFNDLRTDDWDSAAFWSQQCAEKALKSLLLSRGKVYRGHDLLDIARIVREDLGLDLSCLLDDLRELTIHYTVARYPNAANATPSELYTEAKARELVEKAKKVLEWVKQNLQ